MRIGLFTDALAPPTPMDVMGGVALGRDPLEALVEERVEVLVLDDVHAADPLSIDLLARLGDER